jgi:hypothetical protein
VSDLLSTSAGLLPFNTSLAPSAEASQTGEDALKSTPVGRKLMKATQEFEANLISSWWEEAEKGLQDPSASELGAGLDGLKALSMNTMAMGMVKAGGIGISRMIFRSLEPALRRKLDEQNRSVAPSDGHQSQAAPISTDNTGG